MKYLASLYNKARATELNEDPDQDDINQGIALAELVSYIDEARVDSAVAPVFTLIDLTTLYKTRLLEQLGTVLTWHVHSTEHKNRMLRYFPNLEEHKRGRDILLAFNQDVGAALRMACEQDATHVTRTRRAHQVTASVMHLLRHDGYTQYCDELDEGQVTMSVEDGCATRADTSHQFKF